MTSITLSDILQGLKKSRKYKESIEHEMILPEKAPVFSKVDARSFHPKIRALLKKMSLKFWSHQAEAIKNIMNGKNTVISTSTASGKSLCYMLPILNRLLKSGNKETALLIYPFKALSQDQLYKFQYLMNRLDIDPSLIGVYDADTSKDTKRYIRNNCKIIITNPYGLHLYLANHGLWRSFFKNIRHVVFDEIHIYNGVYGSNVAFLMRRLQRIIEVYTQNKDPTWVFCSATIGNPKQLSEKLTGLKFHLVSNDGSRNSKKRFWFWNPIYSEKIHQRVSYHQDTRMMFRDFLKNGIQTLIFVQSRKMAELQALWAKNSFSGTLLENAIMPYRAGYPPRMRREIERRIRDKEILGISSTNALELGVDIGSLDSVIVSGFPGSLTSFWQQAGRCGRVSDDSIVVFCAGADALDQYYISHPDLFFKERFEECVIDLENFYILQGHLKCATKEIPLKEKDVSKFGPMAGKVMKYLVEKGDVVKLNKKYIYNRSDFIAEKIPINSIPSETYKVFEVFKNGRKRLLTVETEDRVFSSLHPNAIYLFMAETYRVINLDLKSKRVFLVKDNVDYYTESRFTTNIKPVILTDTNEVKEVMDKKTLKPSRVFKRIDNLEPLRLYYGNVLVEHVYDSYVVRRFQDRAYIDSYKLDLPPTLFHTKALYFNIPVDIATELLELDKNSLGGGIHAIEHVIISLFPRKVLCSRWDIGGVSKEDDRLFHVPMIYIYDGFPGGIGLTEKAKDSIFELFSVARELIRDCSCEKDSGCPSCIQSPKCGNGNEPLSKKAALIILDRLRETLVNEML
ncbi:MAG: DEAD/DEAH box helicase [Promethearchaeota archaeon]